MRDDLPDLWGRICAAARLPIDTSLDRVHARVGKETVGRTTRQRIRDGVPGTKLSSVYALADASPSAFRSGKPAHPKVSAVSTASATNRT